MGRKKGKGTLIGGFKEGGGFMGSSAVPKRVLPHQEDLHRLDAKEASDTLNVVYTIHDGMKRKAYAPMTRLQDIRKDADISVRAPGQGQTKLIVTEVRFLERYYEEYLRPRKGKELQKAREFKFNGGTYTSAVMYVGASDGHHISQFTQMYPQTLFVLVDGRAPHYGLARGNFRNLFSIKDTWHGGIEVGSFFEGRVPPKEGHDPMKREKDTSKYVTGGPGRDIKASGCPVLFISDLRSIDTRRMGEEAGDSAVEEDHATQERVLESIRLHCDVKAYMLKFRPPYGYDKSNPTGTRAKGELWVQAYAPHSSTEMRIVHTFTRGPADKVEREKYDIQYLEEVMHHINTEERVKDYFDAGLVRCVVSLIRFNRGDENHVDVMRFKDTVASYNVPTGDIVLVKFSSPCGGAAYNLDISPFF